MLSQRGSAREISFFLSPLLAESHHHKPIPTYAHIPKCTPNPSIVLSPVVSSSRTVDEPYPKRTKYTKGKYTMTLPFDTAKGEFLEALRTCDVVCVAGDTGSGKSTRVPSAILDEATAKWEDVRIICSEPRRMAAITLAE